MKTELLFKLEALIVDTCVNYNIIHESRLSFNSRLTPVLLIN